MQLEVENKIKNCVWKIPGKRDRAGKAALLERGGGEGRLSV